METRILHPYHGSWCVVVRFSLKLAAFAVVWSVQTALGYPNVFFELTTLAAMLCVVLGLTRFELPFSRSLNYWDEALCFGLLSHLGKGILEGG
jgi:hypothetical protein